jgi:hypothetical protein
MLNDITTDFEVFSIKPGNTPKRLYILSDYFIAEYCLCTEKFISFRNLLSKDNKIQRALCMWIHPLTGDFIFLSRTRDCCILHIYTENLQFIKNLDSLPVFAYEADIAFNSKGHLYTRSGGMVSVYDAQYMHLFNFSLEWKVYSYVIRSLFIDCFDVLYVPAYDKTEKQHSLVLHGADGMPLKEKQSEGLDVVVKIIIPADRTQLAYDIVTCTDVGILPYFNNKIYKLTYPEPKPEIKI